MTAPGLGAWRLRIVSVRSARAAAVLGMAAAAGGALTGYLYERSVPLLTGVVVAIQGLALVALPLVRRQAVSSSRGSADPR